MRFEDFTLRTPLVLSHGAITTMTQAVARVRVEDGRGRSSVGYGSIFLGDVWAWPSEQVDSAHRVRTMKAVCEVLAAGLPRATEDFAHPLEHGMHLHEVYVPYIAAPAAKVMNVPGDMPLLAASVCFAPMDAAMHDAYGRLHGLSAYDAINSELLPETLDRWLGPPGTGTHLSTFFQRPGSQKIETLHLVGRGDALTDGEVTRPLHDGLPESLEGWIRKEGVFCLKVKLSGTDTAADVARTLDVYRVAVETHRELNTDRRVALTVDPNEACPDVESVVAYLRKLNEASADCYAALRFVEQPVGRNLEADAIDIRPAAALKPVLIDEGLESLRTLRTAEETGWSGIALKTCKGHSLSLLCAAWCRIKGWPFAIADLTNPGLAAVHAAVFASRCGPMMGLELNCRQFVPSANAALAEHLPGVARLSDGCTDVRGAGRIGLGYPDPMIEL